MKHVSNLFLSVIFFERNYFRRKKIPTMIKPYLNHTIHIKNLYTHQDFLKKRLKYTHQFQFSTKQNPQNLTQAHQTKIQLKLLNLLKIVKPITKVDLREYRIIDYDSWEPKILTAF